MLLLLSCDHRRKLSITRAGAQWRFFVSIISSVVDFPPYSLGEDTIGDSGVGDNSAEEVDMGSWTTVLVETPIGLPSNCSMMAPRISVSSFLNSASSTAFISSAFAILNASFTTASTCCMFVFLEIHVYISIILEGPNASYTFECRVPVLLADSMNGSATYLIDGSKRWQTR